MKIVVQDRYTVKGRGFVLKVKADYPYPVKVGDDIEDQDGVKYRVIGIEFVKHLTYPPKYGDTLGLVVTQHMGM